MPGANNFSSLELALSNRRLDASNRCRKSALEDRTLLLEVLNVGGLGGGKMSDFSGVTTVGVVRTVAATTILVDAGLLGFVVEIGTTGLLERVVEPVTTVLEGDCTGEISLVSS